MSSIPQNPQDIHETLKAIENSYKTSKQMPNDELVRTLFEALDTIDELSDNEKKTITRLYQDISKIPASEKPEWIQKYKGLLPKIPLSSFPTTHSITIHSDPLLKKWEKTPPNSPENKAYKAILDYKEKDSDLEGIDLPPLDLSKLHLEELPACLFTDPIFAKTNIHWDSIKKLPSELPTDSLPNIELYGKLTQHLNRLTSPARLVLTTPDLTFSIDEFLTPADSNTSANVNKAFRVASDIAMSKRLQNYRNNNYAELPLEIQKELDQLEKLSKTERRALDLKIEKTIFIAPILSNVFFRYMEFNRRSFWDYPHLVEFSHENECKKIPESSPEREKLIVSEYIRNGSWRLNEFQPDIFLKPYEPMLEKIIDCIPLSEKEKFLKKEHIDEFMNLAYYAIDNSCLKNPASAGPSDLFKSLRSLITLKSATNKEKTALARSTFIKLRHSEEKPSLCDYILMLLLQGQPF